MAIRFDGRVAAITGGGGGLGRSHALMLAAHGAKVVVNDLGCALDGTGRSAEPADRVVREIEAAGGEAIANHDDVQDPAGAQRLVAAALERFGGLDILVNNAGFLRDKSLAKMEPGDFRVIVDNHLMGSVNCTAAAWSHMREKQYGRVVVTSSAAGLFGNFGQSNYGAAKMALIGFMNVAKLEGARYGILVNAVAPIATTRMTEGLMAEHAAPHMTPDYVSAAVGFLCSESCHVSGHIVSAGGGYYARAQIMESEGIVLEPGTKPTPDAIAAAYARISDLSGARYFASIEEYVAKSMGHLPKG